MKHVLTLCLAALLLVPSANAHEGMWLVHMLKQLNEAQMQQLGLQLSAEDIYDINNSSLKDAIVYGVEVPGNEGRAGMAAIHDPEGEIDLQQLASGVKEKLPSYSRPMFLRLVDQLEMTGTETSNKSLIPKH